MSTLPVRRAQPGDIDALIGLRAEAEQWLQAAGIAQWTSDYREYARDVLRTSVDRGDAWVVDDGLVVATLTMNGPDLDFWGWADDKDDAVYLGKMIVARSHAGRDLGDALMNWASDQAAERGKQWIRLDCRRDNERLHGYYRQRGWTYVRTVNPPHRRTQSGALFQRRAGISTPAKTALVTDARSLPS